MFAVQFQDVEKRYHRHAVLSNLNLAVAAGTFTVVYGLPGSGKSVLVRLLTGLEEPTGGRIFLRGQEATLVPAAARNIGYIPQSFALYPHLTVFENIAYPLKLMHMPRGEWAPVVRQVAQLLRIEPLLTKRPDQCSGGEKQRIAIARGIAKRSDIFVLDDPLVGLDFKLRERLVDDLKQMQESLKATFIYTTSDPLEALQLAERVAVLDGGTVVEEGAIIPVYDHPQHLRTMELLGFPRPNLMPGRLEMRDGLCWCRTSLFAFPVQVAVPPGGTEGLAVSVAWRSHDVLLARGAELDGLVTCRTQVVLREDLGGEEIIYLDAAGTQLALVLRRDERDRLITDEVTVGVRPETLVLYAAEGGQRLGQGAAISHV